YALQVTGGTRKEIRAKVPDILRLTGLSTKLHNYPDQLSGGEQQRVSIARAFVNHPPLLLADEPTGNLDPETSIDIMRLLYRINRTGTTVLVATHGAAHSAGGRGLGDVYMRPSSTSSDVVRVRKELLAVPHVKSVQFVSKQAAYNQQSKADPEAYALLASNPLPDTFHVIPDTP